MISHPIPPVYNASSRILILGSFPFVKSREEAFFYGHPKNRFWRVLSSLLNADVPRTIEEKHNLLLSNNIALWDVLASCEIEGSSDASIKNAKANDLSPIFKTANIECIYLNGKTAEKYFFKYLAEKHGYNAIALPSTSPANAKMSLNDLIREWSVILNKL